MTGEDATIAVIDTLNNLYFDYMLVGSFSSNLYAIPRSTKDADFVVDLGERSILDVTRRVGPDLKLNPRMSFETATGTTRHELSLTDDPFKIDSSAESVSAFRLRELPEVVQ